jgi:predicted TIM-barrel fold metal-dependent hydrolase
MIIDAHTHLLPRRLADAIRSWFDEHAWSIQYREEVQAALSRLMAGGIDRVVTLPYAHRPGMSESLNAFTLELAREYSEVVPCCTVFPGEEGADRIVEAALEGPFAGIKIHCHVMRIPPDDARLDGVYRASARYRKPVVIHAGREPAADGYGFDVQSVSGVDRVRSALRRHPEALVVVPHLGMDEYAGFERLLDEFEHLYLDTAMAIAGYFRVQVDLEIIRRRPDRILYGTDYPNLPYDWSRELQVIRDLKLPKSAEELVLFRNAARLFGIRLP